MLASDKACGDRHVDGLHRLLVIAPTTARGLLARIDTLAS